MRRMLILLFAGALAACGGAKAESGLKVLRVSMPSDGPQSLDPVRGSSVYDNRVCSHIFDGLVQYKYLKRPYELEPNLLEAMPEISEDGRTYTMRLKEGVYFHDNKCFEATGGKGREVVASDVFFSWKRMADDDNQSRSWWLLAGKIVGFDEYREAQNEAATFGYDAPVEGLRLFDDDKYKFQIVLKEPVTPFLYILAMFQTFVLPREAHEYYGAAIARNPVGTGPYMLRSWKDWVRGLRITLYRNPSYRDDRYPSEWMPEDEKAGLHLDAGKKLPFADRIDASFFTETQPRWLEFVSRNLDFTTVAAENFGEAFIKRTRKLRRRWRDKGVTAHEISQLDFIYRGFNMEDPVVGGYTDEKRALRRAIHLAMDLEEFNDAFYNSTCVVYDGPIPPGLVGHPDGHLIEGANQGPDLDRARAELAKAGYPGGKGLGKIDMYTSSGGQSKEMSEMMQRQLRRIGVELNVHITEWTTFSEAIHNKKASMFGMAWSSDYPDAENNLAIFYGPNSSPGSNSFNYQNPEFDKQYKLILAMPNGPEREKIMTEMRDTLIRDVPYMGSMARLSHYLVRPWLKNCKPTTVFSGWWKYLDVDESKR
ncbi:MAG: ABC transporter substrate-binding protein [Planctomycetota bacterium]|jgi:ABC-type transport system substrate-binding protein